MATISQVTDEYVLRTRMDDQMSAATVTAERNLEKLEERAQATAAAVQEAGAATQEAGAKIAVAASTFDRFANRLDDVTRAHNALTRAQQQLQQAQAAASREIEAGDADMDRINRTLAEMASRVDAAARKLGEARAEAEANAQATAAWNAVLGQGVTAMDSYAQRVASSAQTSREAQTAAASAAASQAEFNRVLGVNTSSAGFKSAADSASALGSEFDRLRSKYDPLFAASKQYEATLAEIADAEKVGAINAGQAALAREKVTASFAAANAPATAHVATLDKVAVSTGAAAAATRSLGIQFVQGVSGIATGQPILTTFIQQGHQVVDSSLAMGTGFAGIATSAKSLFNAIGGLPVLLGVGVVGGLVAVTAAAESQVSHMADLRQALRLTHADYATLADVADTSARRISATTNIATSDAQKLTQAIASSRYLGDFRSQLDQLTVSAADYARVAGVDAAKAGELFRQAIDDPAAAAKKLAEDGLPTMDASLLRVITRLAESGQNAKATALTFGAIQQATVGATHDLSPLSTELDRLKAAFKGGADGSKGFGESLGEWAELQTSRVVRGLNNVIEVLGKANTAVKAALDAAATAAPNGIDEYGRPNPGPAVPAAGGAGGSLAQVDSTIRTLVQDAATQHQIDVELLARLQLAENRNPTGRDAAGNAVYAASGTGPVGPFQVSPTTYTGLGLTGDPSNNANNTSAAGKLFDHLLDKYGSPYLAVLAYHDGESLMDKVLNGSLDSHGASYQSTSEGIQEATRVTSGYTGTGRPGGVSTLSAVTVSANAGRRTDLDNTSGFVPSANLPASVNRLLGTAGSDGTPEDTAAEISAKLQAARSALADLTAQGTITGPVVERVNNLIAKLGGEAYGAVTPVQAQTRAIADQLGPLAANAGAQRTVAEAINTLRIADEQRGRNITPQEADAVRSATLQKLAADFADVIKATDLQTAANARLAASVDASQPSLIAATNREKALAQARQDFLPGPQQAAAVTAYAAALDKESASAADLATAQKQFDQRDQLATLQAEGALLGQNADAQSKALALLKEKQDLIRRGADLQSAASQADLANVAAIANATAAYNQQKAALSELTGFFDNTFSTISNAITSAFATGEISAAKFGDVAKSVANAVLSEFLKLALLNPLKNFLFGTTDQTLFSVGGVLGSLFSGAGSTAGALTTTAAAAAPALVGLFDGAGTENTSNVGDFTSSGIGGAATAANGAASGGMGVLGTVGTLATLAKGLDWLTGGGLFAAVKDGAHYIIDAAGYTAGQSIGQYVSSLIGEEVGGVAGGTTGALGGAASAEGVAAGGSAAAGAVTDAASESLDIGVGAIGSAVDTVAAALPYIGIAISVVTDLINGNLRGAGLVAGGALIGGGIGSIFGPAGTAIGAAIGAAIGGIVDLVFPQHPKNPYQDTQVALVNGQLVPGKQVAQLEDASGASKQVTEYNTQLQGFLNAVGLKIADPDQADIGHIGNKIKGLTQVDSIADLFHELHFDNADPNDTSNFGIAKHSLISDSFPDIQALSIQLSKVAAFSDALDFVGFQLQSVGKDLTDIQIASVSGSDQGNDLRTALAHDLPGQVFATVDALDAEVNKVNQFVNGTIPGLLNPILTTSSQITEAVAKTRDTYMEAISTAERYGLATDGLVAAQQKAIDMLRAPGVLAIRNANDNAQQAFYSTEQGAQNGPRSASVQFEQQAQSQRDGLKKLWTDTYGDIAVTSQDYLMSMADLEKTIGAERVANAYGAAQALAAAQLNVNAATFGVQARALTLGGDDKDAALVNFDVKAASERLTYSKTLTDFYGMEFLSSQAYQDDLTQLEAVQQGERLAIVQKYGAMTSDAQIAAAEKTAEALAQAESSVGSTVTSIASYLQKLESGSSSPLSPLDQLNLAQSKFNAVSGAARAGDYNSLGQFSTVADSLLSAGRAYYASGPGYTDLFNQVTDAADAISQLSPDTLTASAAAEIAAKNTAPVVDGLAAIRDEVKGLRLAINGMLASAA